MTFLDHNPTLIVDYKDDPNTVEDESEIMSENHYYPFGFNQTGDWYATTAPENKCQYNGKELNWNNYGARYYDPAIARWNAVDPLAVEYYSYSPYNYTLGNPIRFVDPDGASVETLILGGDKALSYIKGTVAPEYRDRISVDGDGAVSVNTDGLLLQELTDGDAGSTTLKNLSESSNNYLYESTEKTSA